MSKIYPYDLGFGLGIVVDDAVEHFPMATVAVGNLPAGRAVSMYCVPVADSLAWR